MGYKDIFISYRNDGIGNNFAKGLSENLKRSGYSVYFNPDEARSGDFPERLKKAIYECKDFLCIVTEDYLNQLRSDNTICWIRDELLYAKECDKHIVPLLINKVSMPENFTEMPESLRFFPKIDAVVFPEEYIISPYSKLCEILRSKNDGKHDFRDVYNSSRLFDPDESLKEILEKAENNDIRSMITAGIYYYYGISGGKDERKASFWFKKVSETKSEFSPIADNFIARMYYAGSMPREPQSYEKSYNYHLLAAKGDIYSAGQVGFMQSIGSGCEFDYDRIEKYYLSILR